MSALNELAAEARAFIDRLAGGARDDDARDALLVRLLRAQMDGVQPYGRLVRARGVEVDAAKSPADLPALPTDVFRFARVASHDAADDVRLFRTSGTSHGERGAHPFRDLSLYDAAAGAAARFALFPDVAHMRLVVLAPSERAAPDSSLSYMLSRFAEWIGDGPTVFALEGGAIDVDALTRALDDTERDRAPVALLATSFALAHAEDALGESRFALPDGSRIMQTGGYKGRAREIDPAEMRATLSTRYGVPHHRIVAEYGMTELSSQMYETTLRHPEEPRRLWAPGWVRVDVVDPETLASVEDDRIGILRVDDVANVGSVCAIQTSDLARRTGDGFELLGRAPGATPRGCSLAIDEALGARGR